MKQLGLVGATLLLLSLARPAAAHPIPFSYLDLRLRPDAIEGTLVAHIYDVAHHLPIAPVERLLDPIVVATHSAEIIKLLSRGLEVTADGKLLTAEWAAPEILAD